MNNTEHGRVKRGITNAVFALRPLILLIFLVGTAVMAYYMLQLRVDAGFKKQLPLDHEYMQTFLDYEREFGGANRVMVALMAKDSEMFTPEFFAAFEEVSSQVFLLPGVDRASVRSIFTPNVRFVEVVEDGFAGGNVIPADFSPSEEMFDRVRSNIIKSGEVGRLVAEDFSGAMVWANLLEEDAATGETLDYQAVANQLEAIRTEFEGDAHTVHIIGFAKIVGDVADGARGVVAYFGLAFLITALLLLIYSKSIWLTVLPLVCSTIAVIWQLGALSLMGFGIDPMNILTPFLVFAIGVSHGVQMISGWSVEKFFGGQSPASMHFKGIALEDVEVVSSLDAAKSTFMRLLAPGAIALLSDTIGFLTILLINIRIIQELAITASIGVAIIIFTNLVLLPILLSYVRMRNAEQFRQKEYAKAARPALIWRLVASSTRPGVSAVLIIAGAALFAAALNKSGDMQIGDSEAGVPELRAEARYNQDARLISERFSLGTDIISIIVQTEAEACARSYEVMSAIDDFGWRIKQIEGVQQVISLPVAAKIAAAGWNEGSLRWKALPRNPDSLTLVTQSFDTSSGLLNRDCSAMPIIVFTEDHKARTIERIVAVVEELKLDIVIDELDYTPSFEPAHGFFASDEDHPAIQFRLATGNVGVMAATNEEVRAAQTPMLLYVYGAIVLLCLITFGSKLVRLFITVPLVLVGIGVVLFAPQMLSDLYFLGALAAVVVLTLFITQGGRGTLCIILPLVLVSYLAYSLMAFLGIGLKVNTLPVVALGVGIGVDYGIYIYSRLDSYLKQGMPLDEAYMHTLRLTGRAVFFTAITLAVGVGTWLFSDLQFQADMGILLAFMFIFNMIGAMLLLPALARWLLRPGVDESITA